MFLCLLNSTKITSFEKLLKQIYAKRCFYHERTLAVIQSAVHIRQVQLSQVLGSWYSAIQIKLYPILLRGGV